MRSLRTCLLMAILLLSVGAYAQKKCLVIFGVNDRITYAPIDGASIELLNDSTKVEFKTISQQDGTYRLEFDYRAGEYTVIVDKEGYSTGIHHFTMGQYRNSIVGAGTLFMEKEKEVKLKEVTVRATRIKMVMRGDTIVYDADAFNLAEGSMLDALVEQLPGAELKDGQIRVNGKLIESLMLNGEDFFAGNPKIALQNLPAYTVKHIKVYDRAANDDYLKGAMAQKLDTEEHMVMDVRLKKKYSRGFISNIDVGYGIPENRYRAKAFGLGYFSRSRIAAFANINNIKDTQMGGTGGNWNGGWAQEGEMDLSMGGLDYLFSKGKFKYSGNATLTHENPVVQRKTSTMSFYDTGDIYGRSFEENTDKKLHLMSKHHLEYSGDNIYMEVNPSLDYMHNKYSRFFRTANFSAAPMEDYRLQSLDSVFAPSWQTSRYASLLLNRQHRHQLGTHDWIIAEADAKATISLPQWGSDNIKLWADGNYRKDDNEAAISFNRLYGTLGNGENTLQSTDYASRTYTVSGGASYMWWYSPYQAERMKSWIVVPSLEAGRQYYDRVNTIHQLHQPFADGDASSGIIPPSAISPEQLMIDRANSYNSIFTQDNYKPGIEVVYLYVPSLNSGVQYTYGASLSDNMLNEHLEYQKSNIDTTLSRFTHSLRPKAYFKYRENNSKRTTQLQLSYSYNTALPSIYNRLRQTDSTDPLNIRTDNPNLHRSQTHSVDFSYNRFNKTNYHNISVSAGYRRTDRAIANAKHYDRTTGVSTWRPENINGNWNANASLNYSMPFGSGKAFQLSSNTAGSFIHSVDYASDSEALERSEVNNLSLSENVSLTYKLGRHSIGAQVGLSWWHSRSARTGFEGFDALNISGGVNATVNLPYNWQLATDINVLTRTGYTDTNLNTTNCVWNAAVSKTLLKGNLVLRLNAVDLLDQISNVQHTVNAQGQTETWVNSLPRYAMLHVIYKLNIMPMKK